MNNLFKKFGTLLFLSLSIGGILFVVTHLLETSGRTYQGGPPGKEWYTEQLELYRKNALLNHVHLISALLFSAIAPFQFWEKFRKKNLAIHKKLGKIFILSSVVVSSSGLIMSFIMPFGKNLETLFATLLFAMVSLAAYKGIYYIKSKKVLVHQAWMLRLFSWSTSIVTMRLVLGAFYEIQPWDDRTWFAVALFLALLVNSLFCEIWVRTRILI